MSKAIFMAVCLLLVRSLVYASSTVVDVWLLSRFQEGGKTVVSSFRPWKRYASGLMEIVIQQHQIANTPARTQQ